MNSLILPCLYLLTLITITNGLICVNCVGSANSGCNDPYNSATSGDIPAPYNTYCAKVVYSTYIERTAGGRSCTPGKGLGGGLIFCCSDKDYCNATTRHIASMIVTIVLTVTSMVIKQFIN